MEIVIERISGRAVVRLDGRFDVTGNLTFRNATRPLLSATEVDTVVVDFDKVPFVDSSALGLLLLLREQAQGAGKHVVLKHCGPDLQRVLSVAHFTTMFRIE